MRKSLIVSGYLALAVAAAVEVEAADIAIDQAGQRFSKSSVEVAVGDTMKFHNSDDVTHNINIIDADDNAADQGLQKPGETITYKFEKAGEFQARCAIHPRMKMTIKVG
jgi:plastocyanin